MYYLIEMESEEYSNLLKNRYKKERIIDPNRDDSSASLCFDDYELYIRLIHHFNECQRIKDLEKESLELRKLKINLAGLKGTLEKL